MLKQQPGLMPQFNFIQLSFSKTLLMFVYRWNRVECKCDVIRREIKIGIFFQLKELFKAPINYEE